MLSTLFSCRSVSSNQLCFLLTSVLRSTITSTTNKKSDEDAEHKNRLSITKKMRLLGLQSHQARKALSIYDDYVHRQKKLPDLRMFAVAINCAMIAEDLSKGREIHQFIESDFPHLKDNLMLKQQLRYFYIKCNDQQSADKLFQPSSTETQRDKKYSSSNSDQLDKRKE
ncbi:hypothetical protein I4U23_017444 [Adineta vaga]|nr:hypothetical protein I4U23_017444 [Adineta vaga]